MMKNVSLLPPEIKAERLSEKKQGVVIKILLLLMLIVLVVFTYLLVSSLIAKNDLDSLEQQREAVERQSQALAEYEELFNDMSRAEDMLNRAMGTNPIWSDVLQEVGESFFPFARLTDLTLNYAGEEGTINMRGLTGSFSDVATLVERFDNLDTINGARVRTSSETGTGDQAEVQFLIDASLIPGSIYLEPEEGGD